MMKQFFKQYSRNPKTRRKAHWHYIYTKASQHGFPIYKANLIWPQDAQFLDLKREWGDIPGLPADRLFFLLNTAEAARKVPGDTADIGVRYGSSSFYMLKGLNDPSRKHHIFDSFEGLSEPSDKDRNAGDKKAFWKAGDIAVDESETRKNLAMFPNCEYYKGWVPTRFNEVAGRKFALVHVDVDLYEPTLDSLKFFYDKMNPGGIILCDDYGFNSCPGAKRAFDEFFADKPESVFHIPTGQSLVVKR